MLRNVVIVMFGFAGMALAQNCAPATNQHLIIYRAGSLTRAFQPLVKEFTCRTGIQVQDTSGGSVDVGRQITAGGKACDLYAPADYLDIDLLMKPAGYATFTIAFAHGRTVLAYSPSGLAAKKLPNIVDPATNKLTAKWYEVLNRPGVSISAGNWFLDPGAYRVPMIFQLAEELYKVPNLYNDLLGHLVILGQNSGAVLGKQFDFQFTYEHSARATAATNPDYKYAQLPDELNFSDSAKESFYRHAVLVVPGLGTPGDARIVPITGSRLQWGITILKNAPNRENAIKFLQMLLGPEGKKALEENGPDPISPALASPGDLYNLPESLRPLVSGKLF